MVNVAKVVALCDAREMKETREREREREGKRGEDRERGRGEGERGKGGEEERKGKREGTLKLGKKLMMLLARKSIFLHPHWLCSINM